MRSDPWIELRISVTFSWFTFLYLSRICDAPFELTEAEFFNPYSTNFIVWDLLGQGLIVQDQVNENRVPTIGAVCGKACALAQMAVESSLYQVEVHEVSSISNDMQLLLWHKLSLGATPCSANGTGSTNGFQPQVNSPHLGLGANLRKIKNKYREKLLRRKNYRFWTEPRPYMVLGLKPMGTPTTWKKKLEVKN